jgi:hypothetical protein
MQSGRSTSQDRGTWRRPMAARGGRLRVPAVAIAVVTALSGCSSISQKFTESMSQMPAIGLPAGAPERPAEPAGYPAVHDIPPPRNSVTLTSIEQQQMEDDLMAARDRQQASAGLAPQPKTKRQLRQQRELQQPQQQRQAQPIVPVSSSRSIY